MSIQGILLILAIVSVMLAVKKFKSLPPAEAKKFLIKAAIYATAALFIVAAATGRIHWFMGIIAAILPLAQRLWGVFNTVQWIKKVIPQKESASVKDSSQNSEIETAYLRMCLQHDTGEISGIILDGPEKGKNLDALSKNTLVGLYQYYCEHDEGSAKLMANFLNRYHPEWQDSQINDSDNTHTLQEAYEILGLKPPVSAEEVRQAHRRLIQKLHPDRGGSSFLATQINRAKEVILQQLD